ncbi:MAG: InlB B-repeat-containing protein [Treponema sp.]|jgi:hypothetical protein|nr:InlB B-repeat-containing protein [Treponema sp.]
MMEGDKKMKTKKRGAYAALAAVLLISAVLITSCPEAINLGGLTIPQGKDQTPFVPPPGMGYVMLNFGLAGRTIRPAAGDFVADVDDFKKFTVFFTATSGGASVGPTDFLSDPVTDPPTAGAKTALEKLEANAFTVTPGTYSIEVWAYNNAAATQYTGAVAYGKSTPITVAAGTGDSRSIALAAITDKEVVGETNTARQGTGIFAWNLTLGANTTAASLTLTTYPDGDPVTGFTSRNIMTTLNSSDVLDPGFYNVSIALSGTNVKSATIREVLHIYQGMTSTYVATLPALSTNVYTITYQYNNGGGTANQSESVTHGNAITGPSPDPTGITYTGYSWVGWFTEDVPVGTASAEGGGTQVVVGTYKPIKNQTLYGRWQSTGINVTVTWDPPEHPNDPVITLTKADSTAFVPGTDKIDREHPITITFGVQAPTTGSYSNHEWTIPTVPSLTGTNATFDVNFGNSAYMDLLIAGTIEIELSVEHSSAVGVPLLVTIKIMVDN